MVLFYWVVWIIDPSVVFKTGYNVRVGGQIDPHWFSRNLTEISTMRKMCLKTEKHYCNLSETIKYVINVIIPFYIWSFSYVKGSY